MIDDVTEPQPPTAPVPRPDRPLRPWAVAVLVLSGAWTAIVWARYAEAVRDGQGSVLFDDTTQSGLGLTIVVTWLVTSTWLGRLHDAAREVAPQDQRYLRIWASFGWVVPIVNLWFPKGVVDVAARALERLPGRGPRVRTGWWWLAWLVAGFVTTPSVYAGGNDPAQVVTLGFAVALTVAWLLWARVVLRVTAAYDGPREAPGAARPAPSA